MQRGDLEWASWGALFADVGTRWGDRRAVIDDDGGLTYEELDHVGAEIGAGLLAVGVAPGDRVGIWMPNCATWIAILAGVARAGATVVPLTPRLRGFEVAEILRRSEATTLFFVDRFLGQDFAEMLGAGEAEHRLPHLVNRYRVSLEVGGGSEITDLRNLGARPGALASLAARTASITPTDPTDLLFTSGTTGHPKGILNNSARSLRVYSDLADVLRIGPADVYYLVPPLSHSFGLKACLLEVMMRGCALVPTMAFEATASLHDIERFGITVLPGPPTIFLGLLNHPERTAYDLSSLRCGVTGAASIPVEMVTRMREEVGLEMVLTAYGLTEATALVTMSVPEDADALIASTCGRPIDGVEVRIAPIGDGSPVAGAVPAALDVGSEGEVQVRGYNVVPGYLDQHDDAGSFTDDGWLRTGDVGVLDEAGYLRITDRLKDIYIVGGFNVAPAEVEDVLCSHPTVSESAVIGVPDERLGEVGAAFVIPRPGANVVTEDLREWCRERLANYKVPRTFEIVADLPRTASGKVQKFQLRTPDA